MCCNNNQLGFGIGTFNSSGCNSCNGGANAEFVNELLSSNGRSGCGRSCGCGRNNCGCGCSCGCANNDF